MNQSRFCTTCFAYRNPDGGEVKQGKIPRWVCKNCAQEIAVRKPRLIAEFAPPKPEKELWRYR
jgi:hypothetical protein